MTGHTFIYSSWQFELRSEKRFIAAGKNKKLRFHQEHSASVVLGVLYDIYKEQNLLMANQSLLRNGT